MTFTSEFIDEVVSNVMRELRGSGSAPTMTPLADGATITAPLVISSRVITEDLLQDMKAEGRSVQLSPGAVVTPSGRDYLRRHSITVQVAASEDTAPSTRQQLLIVGVADGVTAAAASAGWELSTAAGNFDAANQVVQSGPNVRTMCCSPQPSVIACLINRNSSRRAAVVTASTCLTDLRREMNPDVVCFSAAGQSFTQLRKLLHSCSQGTMQRPDDWKELG